MTEHDIQAIGKKLWSMANDVRGKLDLNEVRRYLLALLVYRHLSERQIAYLTAQKLLDLPAELSMDEAYQAVASEKLAELTPTLVAELGYIIAPSDTWSSMRTKVERTEMTLGDYQRVFENLVRSAKVNSRTHPIFQSLFTELGLSKGQLTEEIADLTTTLNNLVKLIADLAIPKDEQLANLYEAIIDQSAAAVGKSGENGLMDTPPAINRLVAGLVGQNLADEQTTYSVYDPLMGAGLLLSAVRDAVLSQGKKVQLYGQEAVASAYGMAMMNFLMHDLAPAELEVSNTNDLAQDWPVMGPSKSYRPRLVDVVVANLLPATKWDSDQSHLKDPRFAGVKKLPPASKAEYAHILQGLYHLKENGVMVVIALRGVLFRKLGEGQIRQTLIEQNYLDAVIELPEKLLYSTSVPIVLLVFKKQRATKEVLFIDASKEAKKQRSQNDLTDQSLARLLTTYQKRQNIAKYAHVANLAELKANDFNLQLSRYVDTFEEPVVDVPALSRQVVQDQQAIKHLTAEIEQLLRQLESQS